ncbi:MAG: HlyC/CorC family transporter [Spirochaetales bacterium]|nr:HlyC/CorC family transporter [Spirochaetales bacterium]
MLLDSLLWQWIISALCLVFFLVLSAYFSGSESAFFSLNRLERDELLRKTPVAKKSIIKEILASQESILVTILTGNMIVNVIATDLFATSLSRQAAEHFPFMSEEVFSMVVMTPLILIFGEMVPKNIAVRHSLRFSQLSVGPLQVFKRLFSPVTGFLLWLHDRILPLHKESDQQADAVRNQLINYAIEIGYKEKMINLYERELFESFLDFRNDLACDMMIPRNHLRGIEDNLSVSQLLSLIEKDDSLIIDSFVLIYHRDFDHLLGYIDVRDLIPYRLGLVGETGLKGHVREFHKIPDSKKLSDLMQELRTSNNQVALVVDEYGGTAGIISFQQIVRDLLDYFYSTDKRSLLEVRSGWYYVPGAMEIDELEDLMDCEVQSDARTVSGMIVEKLGKFPLPGESLVFNNLEFVVKKVGRTRILGLELRRVEP